MQNPRLQRESILAAAVSPFKKAAIAAFFAIMATLVVALPAHARITERAWFKDAAGTLDLAQVKQQNFKPFDALLSAGIGPEVIWVRLRIDPQYENHQHDRLAKEQFFLRINPAYLDRIELFDPLDQTGKRRITGDHYPVADDDQRSFSFGFLIPRGSKAREVYLRIESTSTRFVLPELLTLESWMESDRSRLVVIGICTGIAFLLLVWGLVYWVISRDWLVLSYVVAQTFGLFTTVTLLGQLRYALGDVLTPRLIDGGTSVFVICAVGTATFFYWRFFKEFKPPRWGSGFLLAGVAWEIIALALVLSGTVRVGIFMNWAFVSLMPLAGLVMTSFCRGWSEQALTGKRLLPKRVLMVYFSIVTLATGVSAAAGLGLIQAAPLAVYGAVINNLLSGILLFALLQYRSTLNQRAQAAITTELVLAKELAEQERGHRLDQQKLLTMLAHELKNPLSVISIALDTKADPQQSRAATRQAIHDIRDVIDQCLQADTLNTADLQTRREPVLLGDVLEDLASRMPDIHTPRFALHADAGLCLHTDPRLFRIVLGNVLDNAFRYGDPSAPVQLSVSQPSASELQLMVSNSIGAAGAPDPVHVFDKYYRAPSAQRISGTGLGLYLAKELAEKLGGKLRYEATATTIQFSLCLPATSKPV